MIRVIQVIRVIRVIPVIRVRSMDDADPDADFWLDKSDRERLHALQRCREACFGRAAVVGRCARVLEVVDGA
jgi:hypothetical protein